MRFIASLQLNTSEALVTMQAILPPGVQVFALPRLGVLIIDCPDSYDTDDIRGRVAGCPGVKDVVDDFEIESARATAAGGEK